MKESDGILRESSSFDQRTVEEIERKRSGEGASEGGGKIALKEIRGTRCICPRVLSKLLRCSVAGSNVRGVD
jgi:hypothetical protein